MSGRLVLVGTPIGNLEDISARALRTLGEVDCILAEDTRHSLRLLRHFGINTPLRSWHAHNEQARLAPVLGWLEQGQNLALISDAGMPVICDPGFLLVRAARDAGFVVECVPGPTALISALTLSGLPAERFVFEGFLPARGSARRDALAALCNEPRTALYYESPHRLLASLADIVTVLGAERPVCLAKELTKQFEAVHRGNAAQMLAWAQQAGAAAKGEFVLLVGGITAQPEQRLDAERVFAILAGDLPKRQAAKLTAKLCGGKANDYYQRELAGG